MSAIRYEDWTAERARTARPQMPFWVTASIIVHLLAIAWLLWAPDPPALTMSDHAQEDRPPVEMVVIPPAPTRDATPVPDNVTPDHPTLRPPPRKVQAPSDVPNMQTVDPAALNAFLQRQALKDKETQGGQGSTWTTCSLLSPERRVLEPACDGMMLQHSGSGSDTAVLLAPPDAATLAAIKKYNPEPTAQDVADGLRDHDTNSDSSYRNGADAVYGKMPWEK